jgi:hypothetical protein
MFTKVSQSSASLHQLFVDSEGDPRSVLMREEAAPLTDYTAPHPVMYNSSEEPIISQNHIICETLNSGPLVHTELI